MTRIPAHIGGFRSRVINEIIDHLHAVNPVNSTTIRYERRADGLAANAKNNGGMLPGYTVRWEFNQASSTSLTVGAGTINRLGAAYEWAAADVTGLSTDGTWTIYARLSGGSVTVQKTATWHPANEPFDTGLCAYKLGTVTVASSVISAYEQTHFSDITDGVIIGDADKTASAQKSWQWYANYGQIYGFHSPTLLASLTDTIHTFLVRNAAGPGVELQYTDWATIKSAMETAASGWSVSYATLSGTVTSISGNDHGELANRDVDLSSHSTLYWLMGAAYGRNYGSSIGDTDGNRLVIDLENLQLDGGDWSVNTGHKFTTTNGDIETAGTGVFKNDGNTGLDLLSWFSGGIFAGSSVAARHVKIVDADTEATISGKVLFIPD